MEMWRGIKENFTFENNKHLKQNNKDDKNIFRNIINIQRSSNLR